LSSVRSALVLLAGGAVFARLGAFVASIVLMRSLGPVGFGDYATALSAGALLALVLHSGVQAVAVREAAAKPQDAAGWIRAAIRARLAVSVAGYVLFAAIVPFVGLDARLLWISGALVIPAAFDLKGLSDAVGRTALDVVLEAIAGTAYLGAIVVLSMGGDLTPWLVAAAYLGSRCVYALGVLVRLPTFGPSTVHPPIGKLVFGTAGPVSLAYAADRLTLASDVLLLRAMVGPAEAGLFAAADKLAQLAAVPISLLGRVLAPHLQHSVPHGGARHTLEIALRASAYVVLPVAAGGWVLADALVVRASGPEFADAGAALRWLLVAGALSGVGWRFADMLFAHRRTTAYVTPLFAAVAVNWAASLLLIPRFGAAGSALGTVCAFAVAVPLSYVSLRRVMDFDVLKPLGPPIAAAALVALAAWSVPKSWGALSAVAVGAATYALVMAAFELRRGWAAMGTKLEAASGLALRRREADAAAETLASAE
jgi:O-antigen/teichoic acid export membrane protein